MKKILIVEDEEAIGKVMQEELTDHAFEAKLIAEGGQVVFDTVEHFQPDLIVLDMLLPKMNGLEILKRLKENPKSKAIPVIVSSNLDDEHVSAAMKLGAVDYFVKSQHPVKEIIEKIRKYTATQ